jgi:hypothetical protein
LYNLLDLGRHVLPRPPPIWLPLLFIYLYNLLHNPPLAPPPSLGGQSLSYAFSTLFFTFTTPSPSTFQYPLSCSGPPCHGRYPIVPKTTLAPCQKSPQYDGMATSKGG